MTILACHLSGVIARLTNYDNKPSVFIIALISIKCYQKCSFDAINTE